MRTALLTAAVLALCLLYAVVRYNVLGPVPVEQIPLYITNKAVAVAALILIALAFAARRIAPGSRLGWVRHDRRTLGMTGLSLALLHTALSLLLLNPTYFAKFFNELGQFTALAGASMLTGVVALVFLLVQGRVKAERESVVGLTGGKPPSAGVSIARRKLHGLAICVLALTAGHVLFMGLPGWLTPNLWHGYLPPLTLISFVIALVGLGLGLLPRR